MFKFFSLIFVLLMGWTSYCEAQVVYLSGPGGVGGNGRQGATAESEWVRRKMAEDLLRQAQIDADKENQRKIDNQREHDLRVKQNQDKMYNLIVTLHNELPATASCRQWFWDSTSRYMEESEIKNKENQCRMRLYLEVLHASFPGESSYKNAFWDSTSRYMSKSEIDSIYNSNIAKGRSSCCTTKGRSSCCTTKGRSSCCTTKGRSSCCTTKSGTAKSRSRSKNCSKNSRKTRSAGKRD
ncbi:MAG: hypothetical protein K2X39_06895 [Silvanigrellaceae bacterium]|nr:hypothetical protein [Silvanigrellaceae bacterium]